MDSSGVLPRNVAAVRDFLVQRGPQAPDELDRGLRDAGVVMPASRLAALAERFPDSFVLDGDGRLAVATPDLAAGEGAESGSGEGSQLGDDPGPGEDIPAWLRCQGPEPIAPHDVVVVVAELRGTDGAVPACALLRLRDGETCVLAGGDQAAAARAFSAGARAAVGLGLDTRVSRTWDTLAAADEVAADPHSDDEDPFSAVIDGLPPVRVDLRALALLDDPSRPVSGIDQLSAALGVARPPGQAGRSADNGQAADLLGRAHAAAACLGTLLERFDPDDPSWVLARACLVAGGAPIAALLPDAPLPDGVDDGLRPATDSLLHPSESAEPEYAVKDARGGVRHVFSRLEALEFTARRSQQEMAQAVAEVLDGGGLLAVEAPTGTGKSLAYLSAAGGRAAGSRRPVMVATATKVLQQQLRRDVARLREHGLFPAPFRQLFGVANYICSRALAGAIGGPDAGAGPDHWLALAVAVRALARCETGVWDDVADAALAASRPQYRTIRDALRTDADSCERYDCAYAGQCPLMTHLHDIDRNPGVLSVNHALVAAWARRAEETGRGTVLTPQQHDLIFDEAHDLEDSLTAAWTAATGRSALLGLAARLDGRDGLDRLLRRLARSGVDLRGGRSLPAMARSLRQRLQELTAAVDTYLHEYGDERRSAVLRPALVRARPEYQLLAEAAWRTADELSRAAKEIAAIASTGDNGNAGPGARPLLRSAGTRLRGAARALDQHAEVLKGLRSLADEHLWVYRLAAEPVELAAPAGEPGEWVFEHIPVTVGTAFANAVVRDARSVTLTSATLTSGGTFDYLGDRLGISIEPGVRAAQIFDGRLLDSPFDYATQSALVLTSHLPVPVPTQEREFVEEFGRDQVGFLSLTGGRALTLFAARRRMEAVAELVRQRRDALAARGVELMVQGEVGRAEIAARFRAEPGTVVYGLRSYWQGFDAPGGTLSYLVLEKPPYPHPDDPVIAARVRAIADRGGDPFLDYLVPKTALLLKQGFGRLIRSETDRGVALIADRRMQSPSAANRMLLSSLPGPQEYYADGRDDAWRFAVRFVTGEDPDLSQALALAGSDAEAALAELRLVEDEDPEPKLREAARRLFGIEQLRQEQLELMLAHLGGSDAFAILPTGAGKSLCFQLPALLRAQDRPTVVVSPLVALIKDQLDELRGRRGLSCVQGITAQTPGSLRTEILRDVSAGKVRLLYVSPERLVHDPVLRRALERQDLGALVIDEAHCVSDWGHDFRPEFRRVCAAVAHLSRAPRMALTATATPAVRDDVIRVLEMASPVIVSRPADRPNLAYRVVQVDSSRDRARTLLRVIATKGDTPGIVYTGRRADAEEVALLLRHAGIPARHYHAGMVPEQREAVQDDFLAGTTQVVVATKAFGMGINKPDIEWVVHYDLPDSLDSYAQESGRAARSLQLVGECVLLYSDADIARRRAYQNDNSATGRQAQCARLLDLLQRQGRRGGDVVFDAEEVVEELGVEADELNVLLAWLERTGALSQQPDCSSRGTVHIGLREPSDLEERQRFREIGVRLRLRPSVGSRIDFEKLSDEYGLDADELERDLVTWSLARLITFSSTQRFRRVRLHSTRVDPQALAREAATWHAWQRAQLTAMINYVKGAACRRAAMVDYFGFPAEPCGPLHQACDTCGGESAWRDLPAAATPDPESLIDVDLTVLQAVRWAELATTRPGSRRNGGAAGPGDDGASGRAVARYGEGGLRAAVLGVESLGGRPLSPGLLRCPQFGALRYLRAREGRWNTAVDRLIADGLLSRERTTWQTRTYTALTLTDSGWQRLGGRRA